MSETTETETAHTNRAECEHSDGRGDPARSASAAEEPTAPHGIVCDETVFGDDGATVDTLKE